MAILTERIALDAERGWGYLDVMCSLPTFEYNEKRRAMLVIPGGGYSMVSERESEPIARKYYAAGYNVFILHYSVTNRGADMAAITDKSGHPKPLLEASKAMSIIRRGAERFNIIPDNVAVVGFSAGGHLAASLANLWHLDFVAREAGIEYGENRPDAAILSYPVITGGEYAHRGSFDNLLNGSKNKESDLSLYSIENSVSDKTCPCFIWHTAADGAVPVQNSILLSSALSKAGIPFELHIFPEGAHGLSTAEPDVLRGETSKISEHVKAWMDMSIKWLDYTFDKK